MADIATIRKGLAANLSVLPDVEVSAYMLAEPTPPAAHIVPGAATYDLTLGRGLDELEMKVQVFVGVVSDIGAQQTLDQYLAGSGPLSVKAAIESDRTLGGVVQTLKVPSATGAQLFVRNTGSVLMCEWSVIVYGSGLS